MSKVIVAFAFLLCLNILCFGQVVGGSETNWERYAFQKQGFSVLLPKLPIVISASNYKRSEESVRLGAYSKGTAYVVSYSQEAKDNPLKGYQKIEPFNENNFKLRLEMIRREFESSKEKVDESESEEDGLQITQLVGGDITFKLYFNSKNKSWFELYRYGESDLKSDAEKFFTSVKIEKKPQGKEIGKGASFVIGDNLQSTSSVNSEIGIGLDKSTSLNKSSKPLDGKENFEVQKFRIILKPRASYTEDARRNQLSGTVRVRVTFSANGGVSNVSAIFGLPYGLTDQAIAAAKKILFVPEKHNGVRVSVNKVIEYNFNLY
ncbi:MAG: energy transducer TonB [Pyrinomonadaceae bacterium]